MQGTRKETNGPEFPTMLVPKDLGSSSQGSSQDAYFPSALGNASPEFSLSSGGRGCMNRDSCVGALYEENSSTCGLDGSTTLTLKNSCLSSALQLKGPRTSSSAQSLCRARV